MSREHRPDVEACHDVGDGSGVEVGGDQLVDRPLERAHRDGRPLCQLVGSVDLLGDVGEMEVRQERPSQQGARREVQRRQCLGQAPPRVRVDDSGLRFRSDVLDEIEEIGARLARERLAEEPSEQADVVAKRPVDAILAHPADLWWADSIKSRAPGRPPPRPGRPCSSARSGIPPPRPGKPPRPFLPFLPIIPKRFIIFCISPNCLTRRFTSPTVVPEPVAMRVRRAAVDDLRLAALVERHRADDRLDRLQVVVADLGALQLLRDAGHHPEQTTERAHLLDLLHLIEEVVERELAFHHLHRGLLGLVLLERLLGLLDQGEHVAHAEDPARHAVGVELLEGVELLAGGRERDRAADDLFHRQRRAAAGIAVELRQDHAVDLERGMEGLRRLDGVLAGHRVDHEERVVGRHGAGDEAHLLHHLGVDRQAAGGVDDEHVAAEPLGLLEPLVGGEDRVLGIGVHRHVDLAPETERAPLLDGRRPLQVGTNQERVAALLLEPRREFFDTHRLTF